LPPAPRIVMDVAGLPAGALFGDIEFESIAGDGSPEGAEIEKESVLELILKLLTVMLADPAKAMSVGEMAAVSCVELTKVVWRARPFQFTTEASTKSVPFTVSVIPEELHDGVELDEFVEEEREVMAGARIVNPAVGDAADPGLTSATCVLAGLRRFTDGTTAVRKGPVESVAYVVARVVVTLLLSTH
jgi:hypothetical protein